MKRSLWMTYGMATILLSSSAWASNILPSTTEGSQAKRLSATQTSPLNTQIRQSHNTGRALRIAQADIRREDRRADRQVNRREDRQADRRMDRRADRREDRQANRGLDRRNDRRADRQLDRRADRRMDRQADRRQDRKMDRRADRRADRRIVDHSKRYDNRLAHRERGHFARRDNSGHGSGRSGRR